MHTLVLILYYVCTLDAIFSKSVKTSAVSTISRRRFNKLCMLNVENEFCRLDKHNANGKKLIHPYNQVISENHPQSMEESKTNILPEIPPETYQEYSDEESENPIRDQKLPKNLDNNQKVNDEESDDLMRQNALPPHQDRVDEESIEDSEPKYSLPQVPANDDTNQNKDTNGKNEVDQKHHDAICKSLIPPENCTLRRVSTFKGKWDGYAEVTCQLPKVKVYITHFVEEFRKFGEKEWRSIRITATKELLQEPSMTRGILLHGQPSTEIYELRVRSESNWTSDRCQSEPSNVVLAGMRGHPTNCRITWMAFNNSWIWTGLVELQWQPPKLRKIISEYHVEYTKMYTEDWKLAKVIPERHSDAILTTTFTLSEIDRNTIYMYRVKAKTEYEGDIWMSEPSNVDWVGKPSCPVNARITKLLDRKIPTNIEVIYKRLSMQWEPPEHLGNRNILNYTVEFRKRNKNVTWKIAEVVDGDETEAEIKTKNKTNEYEFRVMAINIAGISEDCMPDYIVRPLAPKSLTVAYLNKNNGTIKLKWKPSLSCGNRECTVWKITIWPTENVNKLMTQRTGPVPLEFMHSLTVNDADVVKKKFYYYTFKSSDLKKLKPNQTLADAKKLKINFKDGKDYTINLRSYNKYFFSRGAAIAHTNS